MERCNMAYINSSEVEELTRLIVKRETVKKEAGIMRDEYTRKFGNLIYEIYKKKMNCIFLKKKIGQCVLRKNRGESILRSEIEMYFDTEMEQYSKDFNEWLDYYDACQSVRTSTEEEVLKAKAAFRRIAKKIHPDILGELGKDPNLLELWEKVKKAYHENDSEELSMLEVLILDFLKKHNVDVYLLEVPNPEIKISIIKLEIDEITSTEPYIYKDILSNPSLCEEKEINLRDELESFINYEKELEETLESYYSEGGDRWKRNLIS